MTTTSIASWALAYVLGAAGDRAGARGGCTAPAFFITHVFFSTGVDTLLPPPSTKRECGRIAALEPERAGAAEMTVP